ncbi:MAG: hypothetical protein Q7U57_00330 [Methylovulum sp.]|nr:hypothetical protein [Methylovulum sp.]
MSSEAETDDLSALLNEPEIVTIKSRRIAVRAFCIENLPEAVKLASELFGDDELKLDQEDYVLRLKDHHIALMQDLTALAVDVPRKSLSLPVTGFMRLFNKVLEVNSDFFLMIIRTITSQPAGPIFSNGLGNTDTIVLNS